MRREQEYARLDGHFDLRLGGTSEDQVASAFDSVVRRGARGFCRVGIIVTGLFGKS